MTLIYDNHDIVSGSILINILVLILKGTHGTTVARANSIKVNGFDLDKGRRGTGIYFWADSPYSRNLAIAWWDFRLSQEDFAGDNDLRCSVIHSEIKTDQNEYLNLDKHDIKKRVAELAIKKKIGFKKDNIAGLYDLFIKTIEKNGEKKINVLEACLSPPPSCSFYHEKILGNPSCFIVRAAKCVNITKD